MKHRTRGTSTPGPTNDPARAFPVLAGLVFIGDVVLHFVRFDPYGQQYWNAVRVFGLPDFQHRKWDMRARREIADGDVVVFAKGPHDQWIALFNGDDEAYL